MNVTKKSFKLAVLAARRFATSPRMMDSCGEKSTNDVPLGYNKLRAKMSQFQANDGRPIHLKGGTLDTILFQSTLLMCVVGLILDFQLYFQLSMPKSE